jgi:pyruvate dehydrogenase E2 component (dihydrolipoamide acetyltransferase)
MYQVKFADIGEGLTEGKVGQVLVKPGDHIKAGDPLFAVETDKVNSDIPSPTSGTIAKVNIIPDQDIKVGDVVVEIDDGKTTSASSPEPVAKKPVVTPSAMVSPTLSQPVEKPTVSRQEPVSSSIKASPLARKVAAVKGIDLTAVIPTGPNGRILVADVEQVAQKNSGLVPKSSMHQIPVSNKALT